MKKIKCMAVFAMLVVMVSLISCTSKTEKQITSMLEAGHETEMRQALQDYQNFCDNGENIFTRQENGLIAYSSEFKNLFKEVEKIHSEYHNAEVLSRDEENWNVWMYYKKNPPKKEIKIEKFLTKCPYCLAEEEGKVTSDNYQWNDTNLFTYKIDDRIEKLLEFMKNSAMQQILVRYKDYIKTEECFSEKQPEKYLLSIDKYENNYEKNTYYVNLTPLLVDISAEYILLHNESHKHLLFGVIQQTLFHNYESAISRGINDSHFNYCIEQNEITCCPICILEYQKVKAGEITPETESWNWSLHEQYFWQENGFARKILDNYATTKNEEKKEKERIAALPFYELETIHDEINNNEIRAKEKFHRKEFRIRAKIDSVKDGYVDLYYGPHLYLPRSELEKLNGGQIITFVTELDFNVNEWRLGDYLFLEDYHFKNVKILDVETPRKNTTTDFSWWFGF